MAGKFPEANRHKPKTKHIPSSAIAEGALPADATGNREQRRAAARKAKGKVQRGGTRPSESGAAAVSTTDQPLRVR